MTTRNPPMSNSFDPLSVAPENITESQQRKGNTGIQAISQQTTNIN